MNATEIAAELWEKRNKGYTHWINKPDEPYGYLVAIPPYNLALPYEDDDYFQNLQTAMLEDWVKRAIACPFAETIGVWADEESCAYCFDVCEIYYDLNNAVSIARLRGEKAIYDIANGVAISVDNANRWVL